MRERIASIALPSLAVVLAAAAAIGAQAPGTFQGVQPQLAAGGGRVYLAFGQNSSISVARSDDGGQTFGAPARLPLTGRLSLGMHRGPRVAATTSAVLVSAIAGAKGGGADGDVFVFRSTDAGRSWSAPLIVNDVAGSAREGLHGMAASPDGLVAIAWLDLRTKGTRVYAAISRNHAATWTADTLVYASPSGSVCECCHPSVAIDPEGRVAIMFRNNVEGYRDMYVVRSDERGGFAGAVRVGRTPWRLNACPMDGGGLAFAGQDLAATWRRDDGIYFSRGSIAEQRVGTGRDPVMGTAGGRHELAWSSSSGVMFMRDSGTPTGVAPGRFPTILSLADRTVLAWEHQGTVGLRVIPR